MYTDHQLRPSNTISDEEWVKAIVALRPEHRTGGYGWVTTWAMVEYFDIHPNRIGSKSRRAYRRGLSTGSNRGDDRGEFELTAKGEALARGHHFLVQREFQRVDPSLAIHDIFLDLPGSTPRRAFDAILKERNDRY